MRRAAAVVAVLALGALVGAGCGSSSKKSKVQLITITHTTTTPGKVEVLTVTRATSQTAPPTQSGGSGGVTAPASANGAGGGSLAAAEALVKSKGYTPTVTYGYKPSNTLGVIIAQRNAHDMRAFFFVNGRYIGTDTSTPSAGIVLRGQDDTSATIGYALYTPDEKICCALTSIDVTYALDNGTLEPQQQIPPDDPKAPLSRR